MIFTSLKKKKKIGFWAGDQNNFQFLDPLMEKLSAYYVTEKFDFFGDEDLLVKQMNSVDLCWFDWCNGPIVNASNLRIKKPIINRIHKFELYQSDPNLVNWNNVDRTILISPSMMMRFEEKFPVQYNTAKPVLIENGVDLSLFSFLDKKNTKKIIYVGRLHHHKNPSLLLQIFAKIIENDPSYELSIIGDFSDEVYKEYFYDQVNKLGLGSHITYQSKIPNKDIVKYLQESDFFLLPSIIEGLSVASLEAMSCGVVPIVHKYYGAEMSYPEENLFETLDQAVQKITHSTHLRQDSRKYVEEKYSLDDKIQRIRDLVEEII